MPESGSRLDVARHQRRRRVLAAVSVIVLVVVILFGSARTGEGVLSGGRHAAIGWAAALAGVVAVIAIIVPLLNAERRRLAARVSRARPGATVIAGAASSETRVDATALGVSRRGLRVGGGPVVLAALPEVIEVWCRGDVAPRWVIDRTRASVQVARQGNGNSSTLGVRITDGARGVRFLPADDSLGMFDEIGRVDSALRALGEDPEHHLRHPG